MTQDQEPTEEQVQRALARSDNYTVGRPYCDYYEHRQDQIALGILALALRRECRYVAEARTLTAEIAKGLGEVLEKLDRVRKT